MMSGQARSSEVIMGLDTHMILETVPVPRSPRRTAHRVINRSSRHYAEALASTPTVHLDRNGNATTFHVHGGGLVISRMVNEFGIAKKVAATIGEAFGTSSAG